MSEPLSRDSFLAVPHQSLPVRKAYGQGFVRGVQLAFVAVVLFAVLSPLFSAWMLPMWFGLGAGVAAGFILVSVQDQVASSREHATTQCPRCQLTLTIPRGEAFTCPACTLTFWWFSAGTTLVVRREDI